MADAHPLAAVVAVVEEPRILPRDAVELIPRVGGGQHVTALLPVPWADLVLPVGGKFGRAPDGSLQIQRVAVAGGQAAVAGVAVHLQITHRGGHVAVEINDVPILVHPADDVRQPRNIHGPPQEKVIQQQQRVLGFHLAQGVCHPLAVGRRGAVHTA